MEAGAEADINGMLLFANGLKTNNHKIPVKLVLHNREIETRGNRIMINRI